MPQTSSISNTLKSKPSDRSTSRIASLAGHSPDLFGEIAWGPRAGSVLGLVRVWAILEHVAIGKVGSQVDRRASEATSGGRHSCDSHHAQSSA